LSGITVIRAGCPAVPALTIGKLAVHQPTRFPLNNDFFLLPFGFLLDQCAGQPYDHPVHLIVIDL
jgi:hypothetical protein